MKMKSRAIAQLLTIGLAHEISAPLVDDSSQLHINNNSTEAIFHEAVIISDLVEKNKALSEQIKILEE